MAEFASLSDIQKSKFRSVSGHEYDGRRLTDRFDTTRPYDRDDWRHSALLFSFKFDKRSGYLFCELDHRMTNNRTFGWDQDGNELSAVLVKAVRIKWGRGILAMKRRRLMRMLAPAALLAILPAYAYAVTDYANAHLTPIYTAESIGVKRLLPEYTFQQPPAWLPPPNATYVYVRGMGDPGTEELEEEVANPVGWDASFYTGFRPYGPYWHLRQKGFANLGPPIGTNVFQVQGYYAGFLINTYQFSHTAPTTTPWGAEDGGPHLAYERRFSPTKEIFTDASSELTLQVYFQLPWLLFGQDAASAQAIFFYYLVDTTSDFRFAGVIEFFDNRPWGDFNGLESLRTDSHDYYVSSPLSSRTFDNKTPRYATMSPYSNPIQNGVKWTSYKFFRAHVSQDNLVSIIEDLETAGITGISEDPKDWRLLRAGVLVEIGFSNQETMANENISIGGSLHHFELYEALDP